MRKFIFFFGFWDTVIYDERFFIRKVYKIFNGDYEKMLWKSLYVRIKLD